MSKHYVIEVNIKEVTRPEPVKNGRGYSDTPTVQPEREIDDVTRVVTKAATLEEAVRKTRRVLCIELQSDAVTPEDQVDFL